MSDDFFKQVGDQVKKGVEWVTDRTGDLLDAGEKQINLMQAKSRLDTQYKELGKMFYEMSAADKLEIEKLRAKCDEVSKTLTEIMQNQTQSKPKDEPEQPKTND